MAGENQVTVTQIGLLNNLATSSQTASQKYIDETNNVHQSFQVRTGGNEGVAIEAFVDKINNLSTQVFAVYPGLLSDFASAISNYSSVLTGAGFSDKVYTDSGDIDNIKTWLSTQRYNSISSKGEKLDAAFKEASAALAKSPNSVDYSADTKSIVSVALENLTHRASVYQSKHDTLMSGKQTFSSELDTVQAGLNQVKIYLNNALYLSQMDVSTLFSWVTSGKLTEGNMDLIDNIQDSGDDEMLDVLLNEGDDKGKFFTNLGEVDGTHVSQGMMDLAYGRFYANAVQSESPSEFDTNNILNFFKSLENQDSKAASVYLEKMTISGDRYAAVMSAKATELLPKFPSKGASSEEYEAYSQAWNNLMTSGKLNEINNKIENAGALTSLFSSAYKEELGVTKRGKSNIEETIKSGMQDLTFSIDGSGQRHFEWTNKVDSESSINTNTTRKVIASLHLTEDDVQKTKIEVKADELDKKRETALKDFTVGLASTVTTFAAPEYSAVVNFANALSKASESGEDKPSTTATLFDKSAALAFGDSYSNLGKGVTQGTSFIKAIESLQSVSSQQNDNERTAEALMFNGGGYSTQIDQGSGSQGAIYTSNYDLSATLAKYDMNENGLRAYIYRNNGGVASQELTEEGWKDVSQDTAKGVKSISKFDREINTDYFDKSYSLNGGGKVTGKEMKDYLTGNGDQNYTDIEASNITEAMDDMTSGLDKDIRDTFQIDNYAKYNSHSFDTLVNAQKQE